MIIDLSQVIKDYDKPMDIALSLDFENTDFLGDEFAFPNGLFVKGSITNITKSLHLKARVTGKILVPCARCRKKTEKNIEFDISEVLVREEETENEIDDDVIVYEGHSVDITDIVMNNFLMNVSSRYLCKEDCRGICPKCGKDLNEGECNCSDDEIDPRWAGLMEIINNSETE